MSSHLDWVAPAACTLPTAERETACCSFFDFTVAETGGAVTVDVRVPDARADVLAGIVAGAESVVEDTTGP